METIQNQTKIKKILLFSGVGILIFIIGIAVGLGIAKVYFNLNKDKIYSSIQNSRKDLSEITSEQIKELTALKPGRTLYGDVKTKEGNQITIVIPFSNPANPKDKKNVEVKIQIDSQDEIFRNDKISSINDIKINDYAVVEILENKKIIYLPTIK